jgi:hypothetical protein
MSCCDSSPVIPDINDVSPLCGRENPGRENRLPLNLPLRRVREEDSDTESDEGRVRKNLRQDEGQTNIVKVNCSSMNGDLKQAVLDGRVADVIKLLDAGASNYSAFRLSVHWGHADIVKVLVDRESISQNRLNKAISTAAENGYIEVVRLLVEHGAVISANELLDDSRHRANPYVLSIEGMYL